MMQAGGSSALAGREFCRSASWSCDSAYHDAHDELMMNVGERLTIPRDSTRSIFRDNSN